MEPTTATTKRCPGFEPTGQAPHELPADLENFNANAGSKDGLSTRCRVCGNLYGKAWAQRQRAVAKADALEPGIERDLALDAAYAILPSKRAPQLTSKGREALVNAGADPAAVAAATSAEDVAEVHDAYQAGLVANTPRERFVAEQAQQPGWTTTTVAGAAYAIPQDPEAVATPEGQEALEVVGAAKRKVGADRKRAERAAKKAQQAATA